MNKVAIHAAADEARRFLLKVEALDSAVLEKQRDFTARKTANPNAVWLISPDGAHMEHAALKRASLDLTRALSSMRNSQ